MWAQAARRRSSSPGSLLSRMHSAMWRRACSRMGSVASWSVGADAAVEGASAFGGLGGVLGDVGGDLAVGQFSGGGDGLRVNLPTPRHCASRQAGDTRGLQV